MVDADKRNAFMKLVVDQMNYPGYLQAFLSTLRHCAYLVVRDLYEMSAKDIPVMLIRGSEDASIPRAVQTELFKRIPQIKVREIIGAGHFPHHEKPIDVGSLLSEFYG